MKKIPAIIGLTAWLLFRGASFGLVYTKHFGMWASNVQHVLNVLTISEVVLIVLCICFAVRPHKVVEEVKPEEPTPQQELVADVQKALPPKKPAVKKPATKKAKPKTK